MTIYHSPKQPIVPLSSKPLYLLMFICTFAFLSCSPTKFLKKGERLITQNTVTIQSDGKIENKSELKYNLFLLTRPKVNGKFLGLFRTRLWYYYKTNSPSDTTKLDNWLRRVIAEPPALYSDDAIEASIENMGNYMRQRGYWNVKVSADTVGAGKKKLGVNYTVLPQKRYYFDRISFASPDKNIERILFKNKDKTFLKRDVPVQNKSYNQETQRITQMLRDSGYALFYSNYVDQLEIDTLTERLSAKLTVLPFRDSTNHPRFRIGRVNIYPDYRAGQENLISYIKMADQDGIAFLSETEDFSIKPEVLLEKIQLVPDQLYQQSQVSRTNRLLGDLGVYRFISIIPYVDSIIPNHLNFDIKLIPQDKWTLGYDLELNTFANSQSNALIGGSFSLNLTNRNLLKGAESFNINTSLGIEISRPEEDRRDQFISTLEGRIKADLSIPKFADPIKLYSFLNFLKIIKTPVLKRLRQEAKTSYSLSYNYVSLFGFYEYNQINASTGYNFKVNNQTSITINHLAIDYLTTQIQDAFEVTLSNNTFLRNSFEEQQFFTGFLFRDIGISWRKDNPATGEAWWIRHALEISGWEVYAGNSIANLFRKNNQYDYSISGVPFSLFGRYEFDGRYLKRNSPKTSTAFRVNTAIALPFGQTKGIPYVKQYFVGGPSSLRAWRIREIGPGGYVDSITLDPQNTLVFYQTGDFKLELNAEYRFNLFKFYAQFEGAFFLDIGNVWTLRKDPNRPGSQLRLNRKYNEENDIIQDLFINQLAIGTGFGLRMDFSYFLIRLDMGYPLRNNYPKPDSPHRNSYWAVHQLNELSLSRINYNLAVGYPF